MSGRNSGTIKIFGSAMLLLGVLICASAFSMETSIRELVPVSSGLPGMPSTPQWVDTPAPSLMWRQLLGIIVGVGMAFGGLVTVLTGLVIAALEAGDDSNL